MTRLSRYEEALAKLTAGWGNRTFNFKAITFGLIGLINTAVDYSVFLAARAAFNRSSGAFAAFDWTANICQCGDAATLSLIAANTIAWIVANSGSYVMNSSVTFAAETGRKLTWRAYFAFVASGTVGWLASTATLLVAAEILLLPVWLAKVVAILVSFVVNFTLSHFFVFRVRKDV